MPTVPLVDPGRFFPSEAEAISQAIHRVIDSRSWILGEEVKNFEHDFAVYTGAAAVVGCANGTDALALALSALRLPNDSEVLVVANDGGYGAIASNQIGLRVRVADIDSMTAGPSIETLNSVFTDSTAALIVTHLHGDLLPLHQIDEWRRERNLYLIEDCAQAQGLFEDGRHVGNVGDLATFSFYPTKNLGAIGDAGAVMIPNGCATHEYLERLTALREYGWGERYRVDYSGGRNSRLDEIQAAILCARLPYLERRNELRRDIHLMISEALSHKEIVERVGTGQPTVAHHIVATLCDSKMQSQIMKHLLERGVKTALHYPFLVQEMIGLQTERFHTPVAADLRRRIITLPSEPLLTDEEKDTLKDALLSLP